MSETRDYQQLVSAHHTFLASVAAQCFLNSPVVSRTLHCLLGLVHRFCAHLESCLGHGGTDGEVVQQLHEEFERAAAQLFFVLSSLRLHRGEQQQHTSQLIMRIDYNRYYSHHSGSLHRLATARGEREWWQEAHQYNSFNEVRQMVTVFSQNTQNLKVKPVFSFKFGCDQIQTVKDRYDK